MMRVYVAVCFACSSFVPSVRADDHQFLMLRGEVISGMQTGPLSGVGISQPVEFRVALRVDQAIVSPWGPVTMFYPMVLEKCELRIGSGESRIDLFPSDDAAGHTLMITSGTTPDGVTADVIEIPRLRLGEGNLSVRFFAFDSNASSFESAHLESLPDIASAASFANSSGDVVTWRLDLASDDPNGRPGRLLLRFDEYSLPVLCVGDIADAFGFLGGNGVIDFGDFVALLGLLGTCRGEKSACVGDFADGFGFPGPDGQVDFGDFIYLLGQLGTICLVD